jgi:hypothetical protein
MGVDTVRLEAIRIELGILATEQYEASQWIDKLLDSWVETRSLRFAYLRDVYTFPSTRRLVDSSLYWRLIAVCEEGPDR